MTIRNLNRLLHPASVALIGASARERSVGRVVLANLLAGGFEGPVYAVNPRPVEAPGAIWAASIEALPTAPDLAIVTTPAPSVPGIVAELGALGTRAAVVISAGITAANGLRQAMLDAAKPNLFRIVGPNCLGALMPHARLNASFAAGTPAAGRLALISQSGALVTAILDWAASRDIGFSGVVSVGDMADVDLGDLIDVFAADPNTDAILMYVEGVTHAAKFMSAARAAARVKPVIAIKAGRGAAGGKAAMSHTGALAGAYEVYEAAFRRAGIVTVETLTEVFDAAEVLCKVRTIAGSRLAIVTNGGGAGVLAVDRLPAVGGVLASLSAPTTEALDDLLPATWSHGNPVDILGDAHPEVYRGAIAAVLADPGLDALMVMNCPTALASPIDAAQAVADAVDAARRSGVRTPVLACWLGDANAAAARPVLGGAQIPLLTTPDGAVDGFGYLLAARAARAALMGAATPHRDIAADPAAARAIIDAARSEGREVLSEVEGKALLAAYGVPVVATRLARAVGEVAAACAGLTAPLAVKIVAPQTTHKSDVGGVALDLPDVAAATAAAKAMAERIGREHPDAKIAGFAVEPMVARPGAHELIAGIADDATFGPLVMFGAGGKAVEVLRDRAIGLPPLDDTLARGMIAATRISRLLAGYRDEPAADLEAVVAVLAALSAMCADLPDILELDINTLLADAGGVLALDARVRISSAPPAAPRLVIRPAPMQWAADLVTRTGLPFHVRPVRPDDEVTLARFLSHVASEDLRAFLATDRPGLGHERIAAMTQIDYHRTMTFIAFDDGEEVIAVATLAADPDREVARLALTVHADTKGRGLSWTLLGHVLRYAAAEGIGAVEAIHPASYVEAIRLEKEVGFSETPCPDDLSKVVVRYRVRS